MDLSEQGLKLIEFKRTFEEFEKRILDKFMN
jgi:hypothetical protein